ncbi:hypothetical protein CY34DRAFT_18617 [Suillus luteus UH-Slu-Lm8-n1]|uniref:Uncharacterized protein n=1 Tax=Suillus luteus UH-Slu-Lm8-n1 TaxID=930992 RepID=A0A0D0A4C3_9AGAM|nr:hypothetical protein CY34DRAFT_18617 [Suillus luteus UH-Slu-Lm8-n1]
MLDQAYECFPCFPRDVITLRTNQLETRDGRYVDITPAIWDNVIDTIETAEVARRTLPDGQPAPSQVDIQDSSTNDKITIKVIEPPHWFQNIEISRDTQSDIGTTSQGTICLFVTPLTKKPIIYLYSPSDIDVSVKLSLIPEWSLSVIYPVVTIEDHGQRLEWNVRTHQDGSLTEHNSGLDVSYLFWEAETNLEAFPLSLTSKPLPEDTFNPISSSLDDMDSVVIPVGKVAIYLDKSLKALGLHTEARTSFVTYWLPSFLKHEYIALRFIPQAAYERAASLSISPKPDVVTRVSMLFKGIPKEHLANWTNAQMQAERDVGWWVDVVGVDPVRAGDVTLFRVLEWGGTEVFK